MPLSRWFAGSHAPDVVIANGDDTPFAVRLGEAIAWCEARPTPELRSEELRPRVLEVDRAAVVRSVLIARHRESAVRSAQPVHRANDLHGGRLLTYFPDAELEEGAAEAETGGFFDVNDTPPWDTWVGLFSDPEASRDSSFATYLVAWMPPGLIETAQRGIDVSMLDCIAWLDGTNTALARRLRRDGFYAR